MKYWWIQPLARGIVACLLPLLVPACITYMLWALPGNPVEIICPPDICSGADGLEERWHLDQGAWEFYSHWISSALQGDLGGSWSVLTGASISELMAQTMPNTLLLILLAMIPISLGVFLGVIQKPTKKWDPLLLAGGVLPVVVLALLAAALVELEFARNTIEGLGYWVKMSIAALTLGISDGIFSSAILGSRSLLEQENQQRYVGISILRGEHNFSNTLPNVMGTLVGQYRTRIVQLLSGSVIVEVIVGVDGFGALLWRGTLSQDFGVVLAGATVFATLSSALLLFQAIIEVGQNLHQRRAPKFLEAIGGPE